MYVLQTTSGWSDLLISVHPAFGVLFCLYISSYITTQCIITIVCHIKFPNKRYSFDVWQILKYKVSGFNYMGVVDKTLY